MQIHHKLKVALYQSLPGIWERARTELALLTAITLTNVVFPEYWSPTNVSSISSFQKRDLNQSKSRFMSASILLDTEVSVVLDACMLAGVSNSNRKSLAALSCHVTHWWVLLRMRTFAETLECTRKQNSSVYFYLQIPDRGKCTIILTLEKISY